MKLDFRLRPGVEPDRRVHRERLLPVFGQFAFGHLGLVLHPQVVGPDSGPDLGVCFSVFVYSGHSVFGQLVGLRDDSFPLDFAEFENALERLKCRHSNCPVVVNQTLKRHN